MEAKINEEPYSAMGSIIDAQDPFTPNNQKQLEICNGYDINCGVDDDELLLLGAKKHHLKNNSKTVDK